MIASMASSPVSLYNILERQDRNSYRKVSNSIEHSVLSIMLHFKPSSYHLRKQACCKPEDSYYAFKNSFLTVYSHKCNNLNKRNTLSVKISREFTNSRISSLSINTSSPSGVSHAVSNLIEVAYNNNNNNNNNNK